MIGGRFGQVIVDAGGDDSAAVERARALVGALLDWRQAASEWPGEIALPSDSVSEWPLQDAGVLKELQEGLAALVTDAEPNLQKQVQIKMQLMENVVHLSSSAGDQAVPKRAAARLVELKLRQQSGPKMPPPDNVKRKWHSGIIGICVIFVTLIGTAIVTQRCSAPFPPEPRATSVPAPSPTIGARSLRFEPEENLETTTGAQYMVAVRVRDGSGKALKSKMVRFDIVTENGKKVTAEHPEITDQEGRAVWHYKAPIELGRYRVRASVDGLYAHRWLDVSQ
jgi:hypothetical protein